MEAQAHELGLLIDGICKKAGFEFEKRADIACGLIEHKEEVLNILTMKPDSRPKARKANRAVRKPATLKDAV